MISKFNIRLEDLSDETMDSIRESLITEEKEELIADCEDKRLSRPDFSQYKNWREVVSALYDIEYFEEYAEKPEQDFVLIELLELWVNERLKQATVGAIFI